jgi:hypothetical protein
MINDIHSPASRFAQLHGASLGRGTEHPDFTAQDRISQMNYEIAKFFELYPGASSDEGYREFLDYYGGGLIRRDGLLLHIWGPDEEFSAEPHWEDVLFDSAHYCPFCCIKISEIGRIDYGFSKNEGGVFQAIEPSTHEIKIIRYCSSFSEWLGLVVKDVNQVLK